MRHIAGFCILWIGLMTAGLASAADAFPKYKPSSRSPEPVDIRIDAYGFHRTAPNALGIGASAPAFSVPRAGGGNVSLAEALTKGPAAIIFYRGHW